MENAVDNCGDKVQAEIVARWKSDQTSDATSGHFCRSEKCRKSYARFTWNQREGRLGSSGRQHRF